MAGVNERGGPRADSAFEPLTAPAPGARAASAPAAASAHQTASASAPTPASSPGPVADVLIEGTVFLDLVFSGLPGPPEPGREIRSAGLGTSPGGAANLAIAMRRLGLGVRLVTVLSDDMYGQYLWRTLEAEGVDLSGVVRDADWPTPVTVSLSFGGDRSMVTHERPRPVNARDLPRAAGPPTRAVVVFLGANEPDWVERVHPDATTIFADVGWDETGRWDEADLARLGACDAFLPNCVEAMAYMRCDTPDDAARALVERVPLVVVKCGGDGAIALRAGSDEIVRAPAIPVLAVDPTGAGDVFDAGFVLGHLAGWDLVESLRFANLCAGLSVRLHGGSLSAPGWQDVSAWIREHPERAPDYQFLGDRANGAWPGASPG